MCYVTSLSGASVVRRMDGRQTDERWMGGRRTDGRTDGSVVIHCSGYSNACVTKSYGKQFFVVPIIVILMYGRPKYEPCSLQVATPSVTATLA